VLCLLNELLLAFENTSRRVSNVAVTETVSCVVTRVTWLRKIHRSKPVGNPYRDILWFYLVPATQLHEIRRL
jgi:hypothetical protein